jgi:hypothetical protein
LSFNRAYDLSLRNDKLSFRGDGEALAEAAGIDYGTARNCGAVARAYDFSSRDEKLSFYHHHRITELLRRARSRHASGGLSERSDNPAQALAEAAGVTSQTRRSIVSVKRG